MLHLLLEQFFQDEFGLVFQSYSEEPEVGVDSVQYYQTFDDYIGSIPDASDPDAIEEEDALPELRQYSSLSQNLILVDLDKLRAAGVPEYIIKKIEENEEELSHVRITRTGRILLTDYKIEIKMTPLDKTLYFLYLRHPEGIRFKDLSDYRQELTDIYLSLTGKDDMDAIAASIDSLTNPLNNSVNEKCSRIKSAFTKAFSPELAKFYYIDGPSGEAKTIELDRDLVTWETIR